MIACQMRHRWFSTASLLVLLSLVSCGINGDTLRNLDAVQHALSAALGQNNIQILLTNGRILNVTVVNFATTTPPTPQDRTKALEIARVAYRSYVSRNMLQAVTVTFTRRRKYLGIFNFDESRAFAFPISQLSQTSSQTPMM